MRDTSACLENVHHDAPFHRLGIVPTPPSVHSTELFVPTTPSTWYTWKSYYPFVDNNILEMLLMQETHNRLRHWTNTALCIDHIHLVPNTLPCKGLWQLPQHLSGVVIHRPAL